MPGMDISYSEGGEKLTVWFAHPSKAKRSEQIGGNMILKKDDSGRVIGVEHLNYFADRNSQAMR